MSCTIEAAIAAIERAHRALDETERAIMIDQLSKSGSTRSGAALTADDFTKWYLKILAIRRSVAPKFNEGMWSILLDMFLHRGKRPVSVSSACQGSGAPATTALRWIALLVDGGFLSRIPAENDFRVVHLSLTDKGQQLIIDWNTRVNQELRRGLSATARNTETPHH